MRVGQLHLNLFWLENFGTLARSNAATGIIDDVAPNHGLWYVRNRTSLATPDLRARGINQWKR